MRYYETGPFSRVESAFVLEPGNKNADSTLEKGSAYYNAFGRCGFSVCVVIKPRALASYQYSHNVMFPTIK